MRARFPRVVLVVAFGVLGLVLSMAYNTYVHAEEAEGGRESGLVDVVEVMETERVVLLDGLSELRDRMAAIEERAAEEAGMAESFGRELEEIQDVAGLTSVTGPGVVVFLADAETIPQGQDPGACLIHDFDIMTVVNVLFAVGAEAVSVNGERVIATTAVRCAGNTILVNSTRLGNPYEIRAIGDPEDLEEALLTDEGVGGLFDTYPVYYGLTARVERKNEIEVPAYLGSLRIEYATAIEEEG